MSMQQRANYEFQAKGFDGAEMVPPAIFHTLIENGLTHGFAGRSNGQFFLEKQSGPASVVYVLRNNGSSQPSQGKPGGGTGLAYVRARLEESYPGRWQFICEPIKSGWQSVITIRE